MLPTRTAGENGRVGAPYGVRYCTFGSAAVSGRLRPLQAAASERIAQHTARTRMSPPGVRDGGTMACTFRARKAELSFVQSWQRACQGDRTFHAMLANMAIRAGHAQCLSSGPVTVAPTQRTNPTWRPFLEPNL